MGQAQRKIDLLASMEMLVHDPLEFVYFVFPWGAGLLKDETGPDEWQARVLKEIGQRSKSVNEAIQIAVRSGHGIGKTALIAWIILWFMSTKPQPQVVVTANTQAQLLGKTWRELAKWHKLAINRDWFEWTATKFYAKWDPETWFAMAIPWSKERSEAFAGTHEKHVLMIYDEGSAIDDKIYEVTEGAMTTPGAMWIVFGNPTKNTGRFRECWGKFRHRWFGIQIDSRNAKKANKSQINNWITDYGEDSDFVRIRVKGEFPRASSTQFIPLDLIEEAMGRKEIPNAFEHAGICIGHDVARYGDDRSVILVRQGLKIHKIMKFREKSLMDLAGYVAEEIRRWKPSAVFVDVVGIGAGVIDRLRQLGYSEIIEVNGGSSAREENKYFNLRAEMWVKMKEWLKVGYLPKDDELKEDLIGPEYGYDNKERLQLEKKEDMKARGLSSPDIADALALTFALPVAPLFGDGKVRSDKAEIEFDVFAN